MIEQFFSRRFPGVAKWFRSGPLGAYMDRFADILAERCYAKFTSKYDIRLAAKLSEWLKKQGLKAEDIDEDRIDKFLRYCAHHYMPRLGDRGALRILLTQLRDDGVIPQPEPKRDESVLHRIECDFARYLHEERGLASKTPRRYGYYVRDFLLDRFGASAIRLNALCPADVNQHILRHVKGKALGTSKLMVVALRSFFRFLRMRGDIACDLAGAVPTVAYWRLATVPKYLLPEEVERVLKKCGRTTPTDKRDYAILVLLARLGLRATEVATMQLEDIDWEAGELTIRGKGAQQDRMPLSGEVGKALATYLRYNRPPCSIRNVFLCVKAPRKALGGGSSIDRIVAKALKQAGLNPAHKGAHIFRHSLATRMIRNQASLSEIGQVLRHRAINTTQIYAKVDISALRSLAQTWPGGAK